MIFRLDLLLRLRPQLRRRPIQVPSNRQHIVVVPSKSPGTADTTLIRPLGPRTAPPAKTPTTHTPNIPAAPKVKDVIFSIVSPWKAPRVPSFVPIRVARAFGRRPTI